MRLGAAQVEVFRHRLAAVAEEMGVVLRQSAFSTNIKERLDFSCAVFDADGALLAQAAHIPVHLGAMAASVAAARRAVADWSSGDLVLLNDPYSGGSHLPDLTTVSAVLAARGDIVAFLATRAHHADVGGAGPGSMQVGADLFGEGLVLPPVLLAARGVFTPVLDVLAANSRSPEERRGDIAAQAAAHRAGEERIRAIADGEPLFRELGVALLARGERAADVALRRLRAGTYSFTDLLDGDGFSDERVAIRVTVTLADGTLAADFSGTDPQVAGSVNAPLAVTTSAVYYVVGCLLGDAPVNDGTWRRVSVRAPNGCLLNPRPPAPVSGGNVETSQRVVDAVLGALAPAAPDLVPAASQGTMNNVAFGGVLADGRAFTYYETLGGGAGAGPHGPGASGIQVHMTNTRNTPVEALESTYPVRVEAYRLRAGSGGPGRYRGGDGIERRLRFLSGARVSLLAERRARGPWGLAGGGAGAPGEDWLDAGGGPHRLASKVSFTVAPDDVLTLRSPGGGGWGASHEPDASP